MNSLELLLWQQLYLEHLRQVEWEYRFRKRPVPRAQPLYRLRTFLGNLLIGSGRKVKGMGSARWAGA